MSHLTEDIHRSQISNQQFLFSKTDIVADVEKKETPKIISTRKIKEKFPDILTEDKFVDVAMTRVADLKKFSAMVVRVDDIHYVIDPDNVMADLAGVIDGICKKSSGVWGLTNNYLMECVFPEKDEKACLQLAQKLKRDLCAKCSETVSVGIAVFPNISYPKDAILKNAKKALDHGDFFGADSCVAFDSVSLNISGDKLYQAGDIGGAIKEFKHALMLNKDDINVHNSLGVCFGIKNDLDNALEEFKTATRLAPKEIMPIYNAGYVHFLKKEYTTALEYFLKAEQIDNTVFELAIQTGRIYLELNQAQNAKKYLKTATTLNRESPAAFRLLGDAYSIISKLSEAITAYKSSLKLNPEDAAALSALGFHYEMQEKNADIALMFCRQGVELDPENGLFRHRLGRLYLNRDLADEALNEFQKAQELGYNSKKYITKALKLV